MPMWNLAQFCRSALGHAGIDGCTDKESELEEGDYVLARQSAIERKAAILYAEPIE